MKDKEYHEVVGERFIASWQDLTKLQKPIIAAVNGYAVRPPQFRDRVVLCSLTLLSCTFILPLRLGTQWSDIVAWRRM